MPISSRWRRAFKLTIGLVVVGILSIGGFFGWRKYEAWRESRQEAPHPTRKRIYYVTITDKDGLEKFLSSCGKPEITVESGHYYVHTFGGNGGMGWILRH